jgi:hypothetical protein
MAKNDRSTRPKPTKAEFIFGKQQAKPGHQVLSLCSTCPLGRAVVKKATAMVKKALKLK